MRYGPQSMKNVHFTNFERPLAVSPFRRPKRSAALPQGCHVNKRVPSENLCQKFVHYDDENSRKDEKLTIVTNKTNTYNMRDENR